MDKDLSSLWSEIMNKLEQQSMASVSFNTWYKDMKLKEIDEEEKIFYVTVPIEFMKTRLTNNSSQLRLVKKCIQDVTKVDYTPIILTEDESNVSLKKESNNFLPKSRLNQKYIFENFVVGKSNEFAHAASLAVAESYLNPHEAHSNPLFIYGGVGLGKTHLMQAIGHFVQSQDPSKKVLYVTSEQFTNELINSIQTNKNEAFRNKYRRVDLLLIDDIQFIADKDRTQEEFFHTFNELHESNRQIVLTSDKPPKDIKALEERLISRFAWGLVVDIGPPDLETRIAILRSKAESEGFNIPNNVINFIAENVKSNIRELEGALSRVMAYSKLTTSEISEQTAAIVLKDLYNTKKEKVINTQIIKEVVAKSYKVNIDDIDSKKRTRSIAYPRQIAMYIARELTDLSLPKIGEEFGGRDHSTVIHAYNKVERDMEEDTSLKIKINNLMREIKE
ncbi:chromosomal replication initiator protein DnaA [Anaerosphaera aminiphila DSM 21120]|uniref:Chromosomal replication initiator protein DnaA n=1 Tax=Anaerosphaera aminiphila DSM 21120 TaxID=1120995 RepID=A0A1M5SCU3_9FIRM|nr:chromosomal replication initiator protein DnaA [Anaerosphaera aminiphila]SHH36397.1 chromosomal replication initiator protein DnaA [Anaerosphaera aminiphila DSM 21120]